LWIFQSPRFPTSDPGPEASLRGQIRDVVLAGIQPDERLLLLLSLIKATDLTNQIFERGERRHAKRRIKDLVEGEESGSAVRSAVADATTAVGIAASAAAITASTAASSANQRGPHRASRMLPRGRPPQAGAAGCGYDALQAGQAIEGGRTMASTVHLEHVGIRTSVDTFDETIRFYTDLLGWSVIEERPSGGPEDRVSFIADGRGGAFEVFVGSSGPIQGPAHLAFA